MEIAWHWYVLVTLLFFVIFVALNRGTRITPRISINMGWVRSISIAYKPIFWFLLEAAGITTVLLLVASQFPKFWETWRYEPGLFFWLTLVALVLLLGVKLRRNHNPDDWFTPLAVAFIIFMIARNGVMDYWHYRLLYAGDTPTEVYVAERDQPFYLEVLGDSVATSVAGVTKYFGEGFYPKPLRMPAKATFSTIDSTGTARVRIWQKVPKRFVGGWLGDKLDKKKEKADSDSHQEKPGSAKASVAKMHQVKKQVERVYNFADYSASGVPIYLSCEVECWYLEPVGPPKESHTGRVFKLAIDQVDGNFTKYDWTGKKPYRLYYPNSYYHLRPALGDELNAGQEPAWGVRVITHHYKWMYH